MTAKSFEELSSLAKQLNDESSDLNSTIAQINHKLAAFNLGIEVWRGPWDGVPLQFGFAKVEDGKVSAWELATRSCVPVRKADDEDGDPVWEPQSDNIGDAESLLRGSRNVRVEGLGQLPAILAELKYEANLKIETIRNAKNIAAELSGCQVSPVKSVNGLPRRKTGEGSCLDTPTNLLGGRI